MESHILNSGLKDGKMFITYDQLIESRFSEVYLKCKFDSYQHFLFQVLMFCLFTDAVYVPEFLS